MTHYDPREWEPEPPNPGEWKLWFAFLLMIASIVIVVIWGREALAAPMIASYAPEVIVIVDPPGDALRCFEPGWLVSLPDGSQTLSTLEAVLVPVALIITPRPQGCILREGFE